MTETKKKRATPKVMRQVDPWSGLMECRVCGSQHSACVRPASNGNFYRGSWQCQFGCRLPDKRAADVAQ